VALIAFMLFAGNIVISSAQVAKRTVSNDDKEQITILIWKMLNWSESKNSIDLLPALTDMKDSSCIGFDFTKHKANLRKLSATGFFAREFIDNYNQIIRTLDRKIRNKEFDKWYTYELPPFAFANDVNSWTLCQDVPYDKPDPLAHVTVDVIRFEKDKGELNWRWGMLPLKNTDASWRQFTYKFRVVKEDNKWKIAYLQGFDFEKSTK